HMNGRVYDPAIGRFLSADPFMQFPDSTQGLNRYTYVGNNPLSYTDPSGFFSLKDLAKTVVGIAASVFLSPVIGGAIMGYLSTGSLKGALLGALGGAISFGIGEAFNGLQGAGALFGKSLLHGISQGILSKAGGGRFGDGFLGGFSASIMSPITGKIKGADATARAARVVTAAVIGGTVAKIGGGKFANGAISGAFVQAFNEEAHYSAKDDVEISKEVTDKVSKIANEYHEKTGRDIVVTSGTRTPQEQAEAMYNKLAGGDDIMSLYKNQNAAAQVRDVYTRGVTDGKTAAAITT